MSHHLNDDSFMHTYIIIIIIIYKVHVFVYASLSFPFSPSLHCLFYRGATKDRWLTIRCRAGISPAATVLAPRVIVDTTCEDR